MFLAFFQFLCHVPQRNWMIFSILFVAPSHGDKDLFCLSHWVTATKRFFCLLHLVTVTNKICKYSQKDAKKVFAFFLQHIPVLFVTVTQCDEQKIHSSQWLSAPSKTNLCYGHSMQQTIVKKKIQFLFSMWQRNWKKSQNQHPFKFEFHHRYQITYLLYSVCLIIEWLLEKNQAETVIMRSLGWDKFNCLNLNAKIKDEKKITDCVIFCNINKF